MKVEKFFEQKKGITVYFATKFSARYTAIDICKFAKDYHEIEQSGELLNFAKFVINEVNIFGNEQTENELVDKYKKINS